MSRHPLAGQSVGAKRADGREVRRRTDGLANLYVYPFYETLLQLLQAEPQQTGGWHVTADALAVGRAYLEQVVNFGRTVQLDEKTGQKKVKFGPRNRHVPIDFFDTSVMEMVAADMVVGDLGWLPDAWEAWRLAQVRQSQIQPARGQDKRQQSIAARDAGDLSDR
jgi:hypothetical protein